jgi:hypothetical protein
LLYEEKFTIAGAKKKLLDEMRGSSARARLAEEVTEKAASSNASSSAVSSGGDRTSSPQTHRVLRMIKSDLEDLLTRLNTDASIKR